jgi:hypothetical protein
MPFKNIPVQEILGPGGGLSAKKYSKKSRDTMPLRFSGAKKGEHFCLFSCHKCIELAEVFER